MAIFKNCLICEKDYRARRNTQKYCSWKCKNHRKGESSAGWKGNNAGYGAIHRWLRKNLPKPNKCINCKKFTSYLDLANISQQYKRDFEDWEYLCRKCHQIKDGRMFARDIKGRIISYKS